MSRKAANLMLAGALFALGLQFVPAGASPEKRTSDYCRTTGVLRASSLPSVVSDGDCDLTGRVIRNGSVGVHVPAPGHAVAVAGIGPMSEDELVVATMLNGDVRIQAGSHSEGGDVVTQGDGTTPCDENSVVGCLDPCVDDDYNVNDVNGGAQGGKPRVRVGQPWFFKGASVPDELTLDEARTHVKLGTGNIVKTKNDCSLSDVVDKTATYEGGTTHNADLNTNNPPNNVCKPFGQTDGKNVVDFGKLFSPPVGLACTWLTSSDGVKWFIKQGDIRLRINGGVNDPEPGTEWTTDPDAAECKGLMDVQSVMTHERGHTFGLAHTDSDESHFMQTMYYAGFQCNSYARTLGKGDRKGLAVLY